MPEPPAGGRGALRAIGQASRGADSKQKSYLVGLGGVIWSTPEGWLGEWVAEDSGVDTDLFGVAPSGSLGMVAVGAEGLALVSSDDGWTRVNTGMSVDFVDFTGWVLLTADGDLFGDEGLALHQWYPLFCD